MTRAPATTTGRPYPAPPWDTHGQAVFCPTLVRPEHLHLPPGLSPVLRRGWALGMLAYVDYRAPSPLEYQELVWMPALTRARLRSGQQVSGYHVAVMLVDSEASLAGGRELWALPKTLGTFQRGPGGVRIRAADGTTLELRYRAWGPGLWAKSAMRTLQPDGGGYVKFVGRTRGRVRLARASIADFAPATSAWESLRHARLLGFGAALEPFHAVMQPPVSLT